MTADAQQVDNAARNAMRNSPSAPDAQLPVRHAGLSHSSLRRGLEPVVSIHFSRSFYNLILLPGSHPSFRDNWLSDILSSMTRSRSLYFSVLACAASHLHFTDAKPQMQELAIRYYSDAVRSLSRQLASGPSTSLVPDGQDDVDVLMPVMFLYLHGFLGLGTYRDIPRHVDAAMRILSARFLDTGATLERTVDKLAVESVLYQVFIVATGIWSERAPRLDQNSNGYVDFWIRAERLLQASSFFPDESILDSPVLGVPVQLLRLVMSICRGIHRPDTIDAAAMRDLRAQVDWWCDAMGLGTTTTTAAAAAAAAAATPATASGPDTSATSSVSPSPASPSPSCSSSSSSSSSSGCSSCSSSSTTSDPALINRDSSHLYALVSSLLLDRLESGDTKLCRPVDPNGKDLPQAARAMRIVHAHSADEAWTSSYLGGWPLYTLGFLVDDPRSVEAIVEDMRNRWTRTRFFIIARYIHDMEVARGLGHTGAIPPEAHRWLAL
ncbi:hypothetical protein GMORB2_6619 [Geosmithia morbida]|uniref:Uncharacterized protein n=1 Tax=Geosmithia morbida TaxID=1094350 RepID=A0A9P4YWN5_9HYPO|nr:uncharacterized protein GMORB2_6619 [Geosmithia morbida]KAF4123071.1 hypothetical protein GMORB2_6619 [Geosmithia morbida]